MRYLVGGSSTKIPHKALQTLNWKHHAKGWADNSVSLPTYLITIKIAFAHIDKFACMLTYEGIVQKFVHQNQINIFDSYTT